AGPDRAVLDYPAAGGGEDAGVGGSTGRMSDGRGLDGRGLADRGGVSARTVAVTTTRVTIATKSEGTFQRISREVREPPTLTLRRRTPMRSTTRRGQRVLPPRGAI